MALAETQDYEAALKRDISGRRRPDAIYLDVLFLPGLAPGQPMKTIPRGGLAYLLSELAGEYQVASVFTIHPYQFSTNTARQLTGLWKTQILKFIRKKR